MYIQDQDSNQRDQEHRHKYPDHAAECFVLQGVISINHGHKDHYNIKDKE